MPVIYTERPGSSQGRGENTLTQQEHDLHSRRCPRTHNVDYMSEKLRYVETHLKEEAGSRHVMDEDVRGILLNVMEAIDPKLSEKNVIDLISGFDKSETRELIASLRGKICRLKDRIAGGNEDPVTRWMLELTLASKEKTLEEQHDNWTTTPPSSDDEEEDERGNCIMEDVCDDGNIVRNLQPAMITEDHASDEGEDDDAFGWHLEAEPLQKKYKIRKTVKDEDVVETRAIESRPWDMVSDVTRPAALMSIPKPTPTAAEVSNRMITNLSIPTTPNHTRIKLCCGDKRTPSSILCLDASDFEKSTSLVSWPVAADSSGASAAVSTKSSVLEQEQQNLINMESEVLRTQENINRQERREVELNIALKEATARRESLTCLKNEHAELTRKFPAKLAELRARVCKAESGWLETLRDAERLLGEDCNPKETFNSASHIPAEAQGEAIEHNEKTDTNNPGFNRYRATLTEQLSQLKGGSVDKHEQKNTNSWSGFPCTLQPKELANRTYGLANLGNTCYMNALLQGLYACKCFRDNVLQTQHVPNAMAGTTSDQLSSEIARTFLKLQNSAQTPTEVFKAICSIDSCRHFADKSQQDICELLMKLQDYWSETNRRLFNLFEGGTKYIVGCFDCTNERDTWDKFTTLSLTLEDKSAYRDETALLASLLNGRLSYEEILDEGNKVQCKQCGVRTTSYQRSCLTNPPPILAIQIKRFEWEDPNSQKLGKANQEEGKKIKTHVNLSEQLTLLGESVEGYRTCTRYKLRAVIEHAGETMSSGHYVAMTKPDHSEGGLWFSYSDTHRTPMNWNQVKKHQAYLLLYEKVNRKSTEVSDHKMITEEPNGAVYVKADRSSNDEPIPLELDVLSRKEVLKVHRDELVTLKCMVKREAERLSYQRLKDKAKTHWKLRGGAEPAKAIEKVEEKSQQNLRTPAKKRERKIDEDDEEPDHKEDKLILRQKKPKPKEVPSPKRRNTNIHPEMNLDAVIEDVAKESSAEKQQSAQEERDILTKDTPAAILDNASLKINEKPIDTSNSLTRNSAALGGERGLRYRWDIDSDLHTDEHCSERERERDKISSDEAKKDQKTRQRIAKLETGPQILHPKSNVSEGAATSADIGEDSQWNTIPKPTICFDSTATTLSKTPEPHEVAIKTKRSQNLNNSLAAGEQDAPTIKINLNEDVQMKEPETSCNAAKDKLAESSSELEKWKNTTIAQIRSLKIELFEDTQLWRQNIAATTVQEIVDSLEKSLVGVFADVENLKATARELFKMFEKQAEVLQLLCDKALSDKDAKELQSELKHIWPKYSEKSPTPACFREASPTTKQKPEQTTAMEWEEGTVGTTTPSCTRNQEINTSAIPRPATRPHQSTQDAINERYDVSDDIRRRLHKYHGNDVAPSLNSPEDHFDYLRKCWYDQIGLPLLGHQKNNIWSFKNALVATGYDRVVLTWQGMFYEVSRADIELGNLLQKQTDPGVSKWVSEGVTVFRWDDTFRHVLRPHRFAMRPYNTPRIDWRVFRPNKYYIHVYQTKIERARSDLRTLSSRAIAQHLRHQWSAHYWPRTTDINMLESMIKGRNVSQRNRAATPRIELPHSQSDLSSVRRTPALRQRRRRRKQLETESSSYTRGEPWRSDRTEVLREERRQNIIGIPERQTTRRRATRRRVIRRGRQTTKSNSSQIIEQCRPHDLADLLNAIQRVSRDVNQLRRKIELK